MRKRFFRDALTVLPQYPIMLGANIAQPDVTLLLDSKGLIREISLSNSLAAENVDAWIGRSWVDTVADGGGDKIERIVEDARVNRVSVFRQVTQRFPSGLEMLMEYTTVCLAGKAGVIAIGRNLQAVAELQSRLIAAQQAMERDYWKLREVETRYRLLFNASNEAVVLVKASNLRVVEANPAALRALGVASQKLEGAIGRDFLAEVATKEHEPFQAMLGRVREHGKAPAILLHLGREHESWLVRASLMNSEGGPLFLLQLAPVGTVQTGSEQRGAISVDELVERGPDGFLVIDHEGTILRGNRAFLDLVQVSAEGSIVGEKLGRWLGRPGADLTVLLATVQRQGVVRLFSTTIHGELGIDVEVEISAVGSGSEHRYIGVLVRDVGRRLTARTDDDHLTSVLNSLTHQVGKTTLRKLVDDTVGVIERHYIESALELTGDNRTAAAELLGLSRQSLYAKLNRYALNNDLQTDLESSR